MEVRLGGHHGEEHHKALKMLKLSSLRQLQREASDSVRWKPELTSVTQLVWCADVVCVCHQVMIPSRVRHSCILRVEAVFVEGLSACVALRLTALCMCV